MGGQLAHALGGNDQDERASRRRAARLQLRRRHPQAQSRRRARRENRLYRSSRQLQLRGAGGARRALRPRAARARRAPRRARADVPHRHHRLADRVPRRHQGRRRRGAGQHASDRGRLPLHARGRRARLLVVSEELLPKFAKAIETSKHLAHVIVSGEAPSLPSPRAGEGQGGGTALRRIARSRQDRCRHRADDARRYVLLALHVGLDRQAERRRAHPRRSKTHRRSLCRANSRHHRKRRLLLGGKTVLRLRPRQCADLPDVGRARPPCCCRIGRRRIWSPIF